MAAGTKLDDYVPLGQHDGGEAAPIGAAAPFAGATPAP